MVEFLVTCTTLSRRPEMGEMTVAEATLKQLTEFGTLANEVSSVLSLITATHQISRNQKVVLLQAAQFLRQVERGNDLYMGGGVWKEGAKEPLVYLNVALVVMEEFTDILPLGEDVGQFFQNMALALERTAEGRLRTSSRYYAAANWFFASLGNRLKKNGWVYRPIELPYEGNHFTDAQIGAALDKLFPALH